MGPIARIAAKKIANNMQQKKEEATPTTPPPKFGARIEAVQSSSTYPTPQQSIVKSAATTLVRETGTTFIKQTAKNAPAEIVAVAKDKGLQTFGNEFKQEAKSAAKNRLQGGSPTSLAEITKNAAVNSGKQIVREGVSNAAMQAAPKALEAGAKKAVGVLLNDAVVPKSTVSQSTPMATKKEPTIYSSNSTKRSKEPLPILQQLENAADQEKLAILNRSYNQQTGWFALAEIYIEQKNWLELSEYINILKTLPKNEVNNNLLHDSKERKSIVHVINKEIPNSDLFNLFEHFNIEDTYIKKFARMDGLKQQMYQHVLTLHSMGSTKQLLLLNKCVAEDTSLGKFFRTSRRFFGYAQTNTIDSLQQEIKSLRQKQQQEHSNSITKKLNDLCSSQETFSITEERLAQRQTPQQYSPTLFNQYDMPVPNTVSSLPAINSEHTKPLINKSTLLLALMISLGLATLLIKFMPLNSSNHDSNEEENNNPLKYF